MPERIVTIERKPYIWVCTPGFVETVHRGLAGHEGRFDAMPTARILKDNDARTIMTIALPGAVPMFVKRFKMASWLERVKAFFFSSKAYREWSTLRRLAALGVPVPTPLALLERRNNGYPTDCYLFTEEIVGAVPLRELVSGDEDQMSADHRAAIRAAAKVVVAVHSAGYFHEDLHTGNVLVRLTNDGAEAFLLDVHRGCFRRLSPALRFLNLAHMYYSLRHVGSVRSSIQFLREYSRIVDIPAGRMLHLVHKLATRIRVRHVRSRAERSLHPSSGYRVELAPGMKIFRRADFPREAVLEILRAHVWQVEHARSSLLKDHPTRRISIVTSDVALMPRDYIVKEEIHRGFASNLGRLLGFSHSRRAWKNTHVLRMSDIPTPEAFALVEEAPGKRETNSSFVVFLRESGAIPLDKFVLTYVAGLAPSDVRTRRTFVRQLARFVAGLHDRGIFHADLKANNVLVGKREGGDFIFSLLDLDRVKIVENVSQPLRIRNLAQLNASIPGVLTRADRLAGFRAYWRCWTGTREATREMIGTIMDITRQRAHVWPGAGK